MLGSLPAGAAEIYINGPCCIADAIYSDLDRNILVADDVSFDTPTVIGGVRFFGVYAAASGGPFTNSVPSADAFVVQVFADNAGQPGALLGTSTLSGTRADTGVLLGSTSLHWFRYEMNLDTPIALAPGLIWFSISNDTTSDTDDDWAWGLTNASPQLALSFDYGATWSDTDRQGNLAFSVFDENGVTSLRLTQAIVDSNNQEITTAEVGSRLTYHIELSNVSGVAASNVTLEDILPEAAVLVDIASNPDITPVIVERRIRWEIGTLTGAAPGNTFAADLSFDLGSAATGTTVSNEVVVASVDEPFAAGSAASVSIDGTNAEAVTLTKRVLRSGEPVGVAAVGDRLSYELTVTNLGVTGRDIVVADQLPAAVSYVGDSGGYEPGTGVWSVGTLAASAPDNAATLTIDVDVLPAASGGTVVNTATVSNLDGAAVNIPDYANVALFGADLYLEGVGVRNLDGQSVTEAAGGAQTRFQFRLTNNGPEATSGVASIAFREVYSPAVNFSGFRTIEVFDTPDFTGPSRQPTGSTGTGCSFSAGVWRCPLERPGGRNNLDPGEIISFEITVRVPELTLDADLTLVTEVTSPTTDPVAANGNAAASVTVLEAPLPDFGESDSRCFIATAAYGSYLEPEVELLRRFRDRYLLTNAPGRVFVRWYYAHSPPIAALIAQRPALKAVTRWSLSPIVYAIKYPLLAAFVMAMLGSLVTGLRMARHRALVIHQLPSEGSAHGD